MNTKWIRSALLVSTLLWWSGSLAQAFYNPNTGRWLNRDPFNEKGGINLLNFNRNGSINWVDLLGLYSCGTSSRQATWLEEMINNTQGAAAQAQWAYGPKMGIDVDYDDCCPDRAKVTKIISEGDVEMVIFPGFSWNDIGADGRSLENHEGVHAANMCNILRDYEEALLPLKNICYKAKCFAELDFWQSAYSRYLLAEAARKDAQFDCRGYGSLMPLGPQRCQDERDFEADARAEKQRADELYARFLSCTTSE